MNYLIRTFGCQMNYADTEKINMLLMQSGAVRVQDTTNADLVIFNTCSVRQKGEDKVFGFIQEIKKLSKKTGKKIIVGITGCMARKTGLHPQYFEKTRERKNARKIELLENNESILNSDDPLFIRNTNFDFVFRIEEVSYLTKILSIICGKDIGNDDKYNDYLKVKQLQENPNSANIIIQTGCDNMCTYCIVPYTRGREISRQKDEILKEIEEVAKNGTKEITLLGQNVNSYGKETKKKLWNPETLTWESWDTKTPFRDLLEDINKIKGIDRIRFTSSNPHDMTRDILDAHFDLDKTCNYLHFALQSGDNEMLKKMNRKHTYEDFKKQVEYLRSKDSLFSVSTDIIVGFPGETEEQFQNTVKAFKECEFDFVYIARYSPRNGTYAGEKLEDNISHEEKARRWNILNNLLGDLVKKRGKMMIGKVEEILISGKLDDGGFTGRTRNFKEVRIDKSENIKIGDIAKVKIIEMRGWIFRGELV